MTAGELRAYLFRDWHSPHPCPEGYRSVDDHFVHPCTFPDKFISIEEMREVARMSINLAFNIR